MPPRIFYFILEKITPCISKQDTQLRECVSPGARLEATLLFLATVSHENFEVALEYHNPRDMPIYIRDAQGTVFEGTFIDY